MPMNQSMILNPPEKRLVVRFSGDLAYLRRAKAAKARAMVIWMATNPMLAAIGEIPVSGHCLHAEQGDVAAQPWTQLPHAAPAWPGAQPVMPAKVVDTAQAPLRGQGSM